jgi:hypothetical protein
VSLDAQPNSGVGNRTGNMRSPDGVATRTKTLGRQQCRSCPLLPVVRLGRPAGIPIRSPRRGDVARRGYSRSTPGALRVDVRRHREPARRQHPGRRAQGDPQERRPRSGEPLGLRSGRRRRRAPRRPARHEVERFAVLADGLKEASQAGLLGRKRVAAQLRGRVFAHPVSSLIARAAPAI